jgi:hypothetical protein
MKNEQEIKNQMEVLKSLDNALDNYDQKIDELLNTKDLEESLRKCEPRKRAEVYWTASFGIYTNKYLELLLDEKDPELHPIKKEIKRLNLFRKKLIDACKNDNEGNGEDNDEKNKRKKIKGNIYKQIKKLNEQNYSKNNQ